MSVQGWPLSQMIFHGHSLKALLKSCDDNHIFDVNVEGTIGVKKKQYTFHKRKKKALDVNVPMSKVDKLLSKKSIYAIGTIFFVP
jgi:hypothetical protein